MAKIVIYMMLVVVIQIALALFVGIGNPSNDTTPITNLVINPENWYINSFYLFLVVQVIGLVGGGLLVGSFFIRNEWVFYIGLLSVLMSFFPPIINLWQVLSAQGFAGPASGFITGLFITPIILTIIGIWLDFSRGKD